MHSTPHRVAQRWLTVVLALFVFSGALACAQTPVPTPEEKPEQFGELNAAKRDVPEDPLVLAPIVWSVLGNAIYPVRGTDGRIHLAYEMHVSNITGAPVRVRSIEVLDAKDSSVTGTNKVVTVDNEEVTGKLRNWAGRPRSPPPTIPTAWVSWLPRWST